MHTVVLVKPVPDIEKVNFDAEKGKIDWSSTPLEINPFDLNALEVAVQIKERLGGTVTAIGMGPLSAESALRDALAKGADRAILLADSRFDGADTHATSYTLAAALRRIGDFDLVVCGERAVDVETGQVGPEVAEYLGLAQLTYVSKITEVREEKICVVSEMSDRAYLMESSLPVLITVTKDVNKPRLPTLQDKLKARKAKIEVWNASDLADTADVAKFGSSGSLTSVLKLVTPPEQGRKGEVFKGDDAATKLARALSDEGMLGR